MVTIAGDTHFIAFFQRLDTIFVVKKKKKIASK